jgi:hypothetical protein
MTEKGKEHQRHVLSTNYKKLLRQVASRCNVLNEIISTEEYNILDVIS